VRITVLIARPQLGSGVLGALGLAMPTADPWAMLTKRFFEVIIMRQVYCVGKLLFHVKRS